MDKGQSYHQERSERIVERLLADSYACNTVQLGAESADCAAKEGMKSFVWTDKI
jgi:predicted aldo/keto reductase-like oxidoreductase